MESQRNTSVSSAGSAVRKTLSRRRWLRMVARGLILTLGASWVGGCQGMRGGAGREIPTEESRSPKVPLATPRLPPGCVVVEVALAEFPATQWRTVLKDLEPYMDRHRFSWEQRQLWDRNGLQAAQLTKLPWQLQELLQRREVSAEEMASLQIKPSAGQTELPEVTPLLSHRRVQLRAGEPKPIPVSDYVSTARWQVHRAEDTVSGESTQVRGWMLLTSQLAGGGGIHLNLTPRLTYGPWQMNIGVVHQALAYRETQTERDFNELTLKFPLQPGELVLAWGLAEPTELGERLFGGLLEPAPESRERVLLIRLVQTQHDDLYEVPSVRGR